MNLPQSDVKRLLNVSLYGETYKEQENIPQKCEAHDEAIQTFKDSDTRQWIAIEKLQNRLPVWATLVISVLTFTLGFVLNYAVMINRM